MTLFPPNFFSAGGGHRRSLGLGLLVSALVVQAQITFTINATPTADALGYAAMAGATMFGFACWRRCQRAVPPAAE